MIKKIDDYIKSENEDPDYKAYEEEFNEFNDCGLAIKKLKDARPWNDGRITYPKDLEENLLREFNTAVDQGFTLLTTKSKEAR
jgi:hypothetical protein